MPLDRLPPSLQHLVLLEWLSPEEVSATARAGSSVLRRAVLSAPMFFSAGNKIVADGCVRWFRKHGVPLRLWTRVIINWWGDKIHFCNGKLHCDGDKPALIREGGDCTWYQNGELHRDGDQPADIDADGTRRWYQRGVIHRDGDRPAIINGIGTQYWYKHGVLHRDKDDLPAVVDEDGSRRWFQNGLLHRDGYLPAVICPLTGWVEWWRHGERMCVSRWKGSPHYDPDYDDVPPNLEWFNCDEPSRR